MRKIKSQENRAYFSLANNIAFKLFILLFLTFLCYSPVFKNQLVNWDDFEYIRDNPLIRNLSMEYIRHIFDPSTFVLGNYHPLTILSYSLEFKAANISPDLIHFNNLLLHLFNITFIYILVNLLTGRTVISTVTAFLFALHPMHVESVAWASERKDVLYTFFFLLSFICYVCFLKKNRNKILWYLLSVFLFILSCLSKGQAVVLTPLLFIADYMLGKPFTIKSLLPKIPFFALSILFGLLAIRAQEYSLTDERLVLFSATERLLFGFYNLGAYLYKLVAPYRLSCFYEYSVKPGGEFPLVFYISPLIVAAVLFSVFWFFRKNRMVVSGVLFFLFSISIVIQLLPVGDAIIADRYSYIPYTGLFMIAGYATDRMLNGSASSRNKFFLKTALILQGVVFCVFTFLQVKTWKTSETLWTHALKINPESPVAYFDRGKHYADNNQIQKAFEDFKNSIRYRPNYPEAWNSLGTLYEKANNNEEAIKCYSQSISYNPSFTLALYNRALTWRKLRNDTNAVRDLNRVLSLAPYNAAAYYMRSLSYRNLKKFDKAIEDYKKALELNPPGSAEACLRAGIALYSEKQYDDAIRLFDRALQMNSRYAEAYGRRSLAWFMKKDFTRALGDAMTAKNLGQAVDEQYIKALEQGVDAGR